MSLEDIPKRFLVATFAKKELTFAPTLKILFVSLEIIRSFFFVKKYYNIHNIYKDPYISKIKYELLNFFKNTLTKVKQIFHLCYYIIIRHKVC